jgi:hypothetical protein
MAGESQQPPSAEPDPSVASYDALARLERALHEYVDGKIAVLVERLGGIDKATSLLNETVNRVPTDLQKATIQLTQVMDEKFGKVTEVSNEKFKSVDTQFAASDKAVAAAFQAQEKQATASEVANQKAIDKSEKATNETITKNSDAAEARAKSQDDKIEGVNRALTDKIDDLKSRQSGTDAQLLALAARGTGTRDATAESRAVSSENRSQNALATQVIAALFGIAGIVTAIVVAVSR